MNRLICALAALFLCLAPAAAQECRPLDEVLDKIAASGRPHVVIEPGPALTRLRAIYAETPPAGDAPPADRVIVVDFGRAMVVIFIMGAAACSPLVTDAPEIRVLAFGVKA